MHVDAADVPLNLPKNNWHCRRPSSDEKSIPFEKLQEVLSDSSVQAMLICISSLPVFSEEMGRAYHDVLDLLRVWKQLKYLLDLPKSQVAIQADL